MKTFKISGKSIVPKKAMVPNMQKGVAYRVFKEKGRLTPSQDITPYQGSRPKFAVRPTSKI